MSATPWLDAVKAHRAGDLDGLLRLATALRESRGPRGPRVELPAIPSPPVRQLVDWPHHDEAALVAVCSSGASALATINVYVVDRTGRRLPPPPTRTPTRRTT